ncbi:MAG: dTDP-4-amino-4,6-dideoxygalactose transaminase [Bacillota bacterium]|nr:dTDP-4-amino-4,6-dideoxygalactose transaminase [Bacillota bacterium]
MKIPFNVSFVDEKDFQYLYKKIDYKKELERRFLEEFNIKRSYFTTSCSSALDMAAQVIEIKEGDEVILPSFTYVTTAMGFVKRGAKLVFADIREDTFTIDIDDVKRKTTNKTKAIVPVHYAGVSADMDVLKEHCSSGNIYLIEDAAQGVDAKYKDKYLGTIGDIGTYSFHDTKNLSSGEGGAFILNNEVLEEKANVVFEKGTDRHAFIKGIVDKYSWKDFGGSYEMSSYLMAILLGQMDKKEIIFKERKRVYEYYKMLLEGYDEIKLTEIPEYATSNHHIFSFLMNSEKERNSTIVRLKEKGVQASFHYQPLHLSSFGKKMGYSRYDLPITEKVVKQILRLPIYPALKNGDIEYIVNNIKK